MARWNSGGPGRPFSQAGLVGACDPARPFRGSSLAPTCVLQPDEAPERAPAQAEAHGRLLNPADLSSLPPEPPAGPTCSSVGTSTHPDSCIAVSRAPDCRLNYTDLLLSDALEDPLLTWLQTCSSLPSPGLQVFLHTWPTPFVLGLAWASPLLTAAYKPSV